MNPQKPPTPELVEQRKQIDRMIATTPNNPICAATAGLLFQASLHPATQWVTQDGAYYADEEDEDDCRPF